MTATTQSVLGVDVGGVIIVRNDDSADTSFFGENYLSTPPVEDAFDVLSRLHDGLFAGRIVIISKCGESVEAKTRDWLAHHRFHEITGIGPDRLHFTRTRQEKRPVAVSLGVTHFVDDRPEVLEAMQGTRHRYLFTGGAEDAVDHPPAPAGAVEVGSWRELERAILHTLGG